MIASIYADYSMNMSDWVHKNVNMCMLNHIVRIVVCVCDIDADTKQED